MSPRQVRKAEPRKGAQDADGRTVRYDLPDSTFPEPVIPGVRGWRTTEGWLVLRLHYSADPERADEGWIAEQVRGYRGGRQGRDWRREMEIDFSAYAGEPVYNYFNADESVKATRYRPELPLWRGWDFGYRHPAVVWVQLWPASEQAPDGTLVVLHEFYPTLNRESTPGIKTADLAEQVLEVTAEVFPETRSEHHDAQVFDFADPAGNQTKETSDFSSIEILQQHGIYPEHSVVGRKNRIAYLRRYIEDPNAFRINPHCSLTIKALSSAYRYPEEKSGGADRDMPDLGKKVQEEPYVHLMDALEYVAACNLEIPWNPDSRRHEEVKRVGTLDELLAHTASPFAERVETADAAAALEHELEVSLHDLVGETGDLRDVWRLT